MLAMGGGNLQPREVETFITGLFCQYSSKLDKYGRKMMAEHEFQDFLEGFTGMPHDPAIRAAVYKFDEKIDEQKGTAAEFGLSPEEAEEGLNLASFAELLTETAERLPSGTMSSIIAGRHYLCGGNVAVLAQSMRTVGNLSSEKRPWRPPGH